MTTLDTWQQLLERLTTVPASKVLEAAEVIEKLSGSWAASSSTYPMMLGSYTSEDAAIPNSESMRISRLGYPGFPEINFAPYAFGTNRFGPKGGSFIGHPISFEPVGPTLKDPTGTPWSWAVTNNDSGASGDYLDLEAGGRNLEDLYNITDLTDYPGGLYVVVLMTGQEGPFAGGGGVGDGAGFNAVASDPLEAKSEASKWEIFRVVEIPSDTRLILDPTKRLSTYFDFPADPNGRLRAVMLIQPKATRLVALPELGGTRGKETTFAFVPPSRALNQDTSYPFDVWNTALGWNEYWLIDAGGGANFVIGQGISDDYSFKQHLPIPRPNGTAVFRLPDATTTLFAGRVRIISVSGSVAVGDIIHVYEVLASNGAELSVNGAGRGVSWSALYGWFEVVNIGGGGAIDVRRIEEIDPKTGVSYFGSPEALTQSDPVTATKYIGLLATVHSPVSTLWTSSYLDFDAVDSARLTNLIDPKWVSRSIKTSGQTACRADRAVFDTRGTGSAGENADPGSLLDLGFRVVLFPAIAGDELGTTIAVPDWSRPITSNEVVLDPSKPDEKQYIEIDYANGLVRLSHAPQPDSDVWPGDMTGVTDNPRGELVLFACCVPYSMEEGQLGASAAVSAAPTLTSGADNPDQAAPFSERWYFPLTAQTVNSATTNRLTSIDLDGWVIDQIPPSGVIEVLWGTDPTGTPLFNPGGGNARGSVFIYQGALESAGPNVTSLQKVYGGGAIPSTATVDATHPAVAVFRRDYLLPQSLDGLLTLPYQVDTQYGSAKRARMLRFEDSELRVNLDGSVTVKSQNTSAEEQEALFADLFSSWLLSGGVVSYNSGGGGSDFIFDIAPSVVLKEGKRQDVGATTVAVPDTDADYYLYFTSTGTAPVVSAVTVPPAGLPLPSSEDILLAKVTITGGGTLYSILDMQYPLTDIDQRVNIYVGQVEGMESATPFFNNLADAVAYVNEMQTPTTGDAQRRYRIVIVGYTDEDAAKLPIQIKTEGLIIEGSPRVASGAEKVEVRWGAADKALIDLYGKDRTTIRGVSFRSTLDPLDPGRNRLTPDRVVFTNTSASDLDGLVIENCTLYGEAQGLLAISDKGVPVNARIRMNRAPEVLDFGIYIYDVSYCAMDSVIEQNYFIQNTTPGGMAAADQCGIYLNGSAGGTGLQTTLENNRTYRFQHGLSVNLDNSTLRGNRVLSSVLEGMTVVGDNNEVSHNILTAIYTSAAPKVGMLITANNNQVTGNYVTISGYSAGDYGISVTGNGGTVGNTLRDNKAEALLVDAADSVIDACTTDVLAVSKADCKVTNSSVTSVCYLVAGSDRTYIANSEISTLYAGVAFPGYTSVSAYHHIVNLNSAITYLGDDCRVENSKFSTSLTVRHRANIQNCYIADLYDYTATFASLLNTDLLFIGNDIQQVRGGTYFRFICTKSIFKGNFFRTSLFLRGYDGMGTRGGTYFFEGNHVTGALRIGCAAAYEAGGDPAYPTLNSKILGNTVGTNVILYSDTGSRDHVESNYFGGAMSLTADDVVVSGNQGITPVTSALDVVGVRAVIRGNSVYSISTNDVGKLGPGIIADNLAVAAVWAKSPNYTVSGNRSATLQVDYGSVLTGNDTSGDITIDNGPCVVLGNSVGGMVMFTNSSSTSTIIGNRVLGVGVAGGINAGAVGNSIAMGNMVTNGTVLGVTPIFSAGPLQTEQAAGGANYNADGT